MYVSEYINRYANMFRRGKGAESFFLGSVRHFIFSPQRQNSNCLLPGSGNGHGNGNGKGNGNGYLHFIFNSHLGAAL